MLSCRNFQKRKALMRCLHLVCMMSMILSADGIAPALCVWMANWDQSHQLQVSADAESGAVLVLSHGEDEEETTESWDDHGILIDLILMLGRRADIPHEDHVLLFSSLDNARRHQARSLPEGIASQPQTNVSVAVPFLLDRMSHPQGRAHTRGRFSPGLEVRRSRQIMRC